MIHANATRAAQTALFSGLSQAGELIPAPPGVDRLRAHVPMDSDEAGAVPEIPVEVSGDEDSGVPRLSPDHRLQLQILWELTAMLDGRPNLNLVLPTVLEGVYRGLGLDRALLLLLNGSRDTLKARHAVP